jgi:bacteriocin-like protein
MINPQNKDENNDVTIVGTDFFTDSESFLNELTDDELQHVIGGDNYALAASTESHQYCDIHISHYCGGNYAFQDALQDSGWEQQP